MRRNGIDTPASRVQPGAGAPRAGVRRCWLAGGGGRPVLGHTQGAGLLCALPGEAGWRGAACGVPGAPKRTHCCAPCATPPAPGAPSQTAAPAAAPPLLSQYHYRPGTLSGWLASALNKYSKRRRRAWGRRQRCKPGSSLACASDAKTHAPGSHARAQLTGPRHPRTHTRRRAPRARVHGRLLRHDALRPRQRAAAGADAKLAARSSWQQLAARHSWQRAQLAAWRRWRLLAAAGGGFWQRQLTAGQSRLQQLVATAACCTACSSMLPAGTWARLLPRARPPRTHLTLPTHTHTPGQDARRCAGGGPHS